LTSSKYGNISGAVWSPDGKWIAYSKADQTRNTDIYLIPSAGGQERKVTFDSYSERQPRFSADGKKLYFTLSEGGGGAGGRGGAGGGSQLYVVALEKQDRDPEDPEEADQNDQPAGRRWTRRAWRRRGRPAGRQGRQHRLGRLEATHPPDHADALWRRNLRPLRQIRAHWFSSRPNRRGCAAHR